MRHFVYLALSCAIVVTTTRLPVRADVCPDGQCPRVLQPGPGAVATQPAVGELPVDARSIARIVNVRGQARALGSGTLVDVHGPRGLVLTCAHLFRDGPGSISVTFPGGGSFAARMLRIDAGADLAALSIAAPALQPIRLARDFPQRGDPLVSCGYGSDGRLSCNRGRALGYVTTHGSHGRETLELSGAARMGDSGGPVLDRHGYLVAVLFGTDGRVVDGTFCGRIRRFLQGLSPRFGGAARPRPLPGPAEPAGPLVDVVPPRRRPQPSPPPSGQSPAKEPTGPLETIAQPWLSGKLTALLVTFGLPSGIAGAAGGAIVWLAMRRGRRRLKAELARLQGRATAAVAELAGEQVVERHHNQYVPYELPALDKAWAAAHARVGERYPGAVPYLKIVEGVKDQLLSGNEEPQVS